MTWDQSTPAAPFDPRYFCALIVVDRRLWLLGGTGQTNYPLPDVWASVDGVQWVSQAPLPGPLTNSAAVVVGSSILTIGGYGTSFSGVEFRVVGVRTASPFGSSASFWLLSTRQ